MEQLIELLVLCRSPTATALHGTAHAQPAQVLADAVGLDMNCSSVCSYLIALSACRRGGLTEMNRYSSTPIVLAAGLADLRVSGQYKTGDSEGFARAVAALHGLAVQAHAARIELGRK